MKDEFSQRTSEKAQTKMLRCQKKFCSGSGNDTWSRGKVFAAAGRETPPHMQLSEPAQYSLMRHVLTRSDLSYHGTNLTSMLIERHHNSLELGNVNASQRRLSSGSWDGTWGRGEVFAAAGREA